MAAAAKQSTVASVPRKANDCAHNFGWAQTLPHLVDSTVQGFTPTQPKSARTDAGKAVFVARHRCAETSGNADGFAGRKVPIFVMKTRRRCAVGASSAPLETDRQARTSLELRQVASNPREFPGQRAVRPCLFPMPKLLTRPAFFGFVAARLFQPG